MFFIKKYLGVFLSTYYILTMLTKKHEKTTKNFVCEKCDYITSKQSEWNRHITTRKHKNIDKCLQEKSHKLTCVCGNKYKYRQSLSVHRKTCIKYNSEENNIICDTEEKEGKDTLSLLKNEQTDLKNIILELVKSNTELQKQMLDVCKNNNTTINSHNKTFNMQVFLNEKCKDAMNIMDFVNSMDLQLSDLEELGELGYVEGISRQMIRKLSELDVYKRPIHCSDLKRETIYVRDNGVWEKENITYDKLRKAIKYVTAKNGYLLEPWRDAHPQCMNTQHPLNDVYVQIMSQAMGGKGEFTDSENKIIKKVSKVITIDKNDY